MRVLSDAIRCDAASLIKAKTAESVRPANRRLESVAPVIDDLNTGVACGRSDRARGKPQIVDNLLFENENGKQAHAVFDLRDDAEAAAENKFG